MISVYERLRDANFKDFTNIKSRKDLFMEFDHDFGGRLIHFDYGMYVDGMKWLEYNGKTIYSIVADDFNQMIRFIGLTVKEFIVLLYHECAVSSKFFVSEICRAPTMEGIYNPFELDIGKFAQLRAFEDSINSVLYNPRQSGSTMFLCALYNWVKLFRPYSANILVPCRSKTDYELFMAKVDAVEAGLPPIFFHPEITPTFHYRNNSQFINYLMINDFEFLTDMQYQYIDTINGIKSKENIGVYPSRIGFSTKIQVVANSTINKNPSELLESIVSSKYVTMNERYFDQPSRQLSITRVPHHIDPNKIVEIAPRDFNKYILEIRFDEKHIMTEEELSHIQKILPAEYYDTEIRRVRPLKTGAAI